MTGRLIVASVRLPVTVAREDEGLRISASAGGLVTALAAVRESREFSWFGWPGDYFTDVERELVEKQLLDQAASPVFLDKDEVEGFYEGFSNETLWPLFHNLTERVAFDRNKWAIYVRVNQLYADRIAQVAAPGDLIWIHDYQLCLVPQMLKAKGLGCPIGFFLHVPFPSADIYRTLPVCEEILRGLLGADLIGFHAYEYVSHFRSACLRVLGIESEASFVPLQSRGAKLEVLPIGIEPGEVRDMLRTLEARREETDLSRTFAGKRIVVGVDRLDYTKGIPQKLLAFEEMLETHSEWRESVVLVQVAAPSRTGVDEYQQLKREVDELVGRINGKFSTPSHTPVVYINQSLSRVRLTGLYRASDIALVTPLRDGMNLVALEYVAARRGRGGALILSEFCGAAHCLPGSKLVNPFNTSQVAQVLADALENDGPHLESFVHMERFVDTNTSTAWAGKFLSSLENLGGDPSKKARSFSLKEPEVRALVEGADRPLIFLDYDGTLRSYVINPKEAVPDRRILSTLERLSQLAIVYVVSGRDAATLDEWLGHLPIGLVCEHGLAIKDAREGWKTTKNVNGAALHRLVKPLFEDFVGRTPGSSIEVKQAAIAWHSRAADPEYSAFQSRELLTRLGELLRRRPYKVLRGNRVIEVRHENVTKGSAVSELLEKHGSSDFLFCAGDDRTDEDMMTAIGPAWRPRTITCWVGAPSVHADYWRESNLGLLNQLDAMADIWEARKLRAQQVEGPSHSKSGVQAKAGPSSSPIRKSSRKAP